MNIEGFISKAQMEIELLRESLFHVENDVAIRVLENAIHNREIAITKAKEKHGI